MSQISEITCEEEWLAIVWEFMLAHPDDYPDEDDFFRAETDLIYDRDRTEEEDDNLRNLDLI